MYFQPEAIFAHKRTLLFTTAISAGVIISSAGSAEECGFNVPSQDLGGALALCAVQGGRAIVFFEGAAQARCAPAGFGEYSECEAPALPPEAGDAVSARSDGGVMFMRTPDKKSVETPPEDNIVIVTGTNIRGAQDPAPPALQIGREDIDLSGVAAAAAGKRYGAVAKGAGRSFHRNLSPPSGALVRLIGGASL